jgi:general secretion pathway protein D
MLPGCELIGPKQNQLLTLQATPANLKPSAETDDAKKLQNKIVISEPKKPKAELYPGTSPIIAPSLEAQKTAASMKGTFNLKFDEADLGEVAKAILGDMLGQNYVLSPKVAGKVTLNTTQPLTREELLPTLEMILRMNNAALVKDGKIFHIEPVADALFTSDLSLGPGRAGFQTRVIPIKNVAADDIAEVLKPLVQEKTILNVDASRNLLVASGTPDEMSRVIDMVATFDIDVLKGRSFGLFPLAHTDPETVIKELEEIFDKKGDESSFFRFMSIERMNAVMAITHQARYLRDIEDWVTRLDKASAGAGGGVNVYKVQHADAEELADTLNEIFTGAASTDRSAKVAAGRKASEISNKPAGDSTTKTTKKSSAKKRETSNSLSKRSSSGSAAGGSAVANIEDVRIISDKANNALIIVATPREYDIILPVIKQLDLMPLQVLIDATIVSVDLKDDLKYGIQWKLNHDQSAVSGSTGPARLGVDRNGNASIAAAEAFASGGLSAVYNSGAVNALLASQANKDNINVISSPSLMVLNNQEAIIDVGTQIPTLSSTLSGAGISSDTTGSGSTGLVTNSQIQYRDTGVKLEVTPRVNANGMVIMDIKQTVSDPVESIIGVTTSAAISKKEIESSVAVQDGETIVLGGLIKENNTYNKAGIPLLHELPWIGPLFGSTVNNKDKSELVVLITPRVVKSKQDSRIISNEFRRKLTGIYRKE